MASFSESVTAYVRRLDAESSKAVARVAHSTRARIVDEQRQRYGVDPGVMHAVDGVRDAEFETVKPDGLIWLGFDYMREAIMFAFDSLILRSPVDSGTYVNSHFAVLDDTTKLPPLTPPSLEELRGVSKVTITNPQPYARRLEVALDKSGASFVKQVEPHIFESTAMVVRKAYRQVVKVEFNYVDLAGAWGGANKLGHYRMRRKFIHGRLGLDERTETELKQRAKIRAPAIIISRRER